MLLAWIVAICSFAFQFSNSQRSCKFPSVLAFLYAHICAICSRAFSHSCFLDHSYSSNLLARFLTCTLSCKLLYRAPHFLLACFLHTVCLLSCFHNQKCYCNLLTWFLTLFVANMIAICLLLCLVSWMCSFCFLARFHASF